MRQLRSILPRGYQEGPQLSVNQLHDESLTMGQKIADGVARTMGSWRFIIIQSTILFAWIILNIAEVLFRPWDPYPFILLNLALSFQAAYAAPIIMMSQNRQADKDRLAAEHDYCVNIRADATVKAVLDHLQAQDEVLLALLDHFQRVHEVKPSDSQREAQARLATMRLVEAELLRLKVRDEEVKAGLKPT
ncbi:MAG: DUF1003 domain-containing protein [Chloroflexi bacterium]|nr:DUF1003 domain-containing protein [Chloroflexota bacterium]